MKSRVERKKVDLVCPRCSRKISSVWIIRYHSFQYSQLVRVCSKCENVIGVSSPEPGPETGAPAVTRPLRRRRTSR